MGQLRAWGAKGRLGGAATTRPLRLSATQARTTAAHHRWPRHRQRRRATAALGHGSRSRRSCPQGGSLGARPARPGHLFVGRAGRQPQAGSLPGAVGWRRRMHFSTPGGARLRRERMASLRGHLAHATHDRTELSKSLPNTAHRIRGARCKDRRGEHAGRPRPLGASLPPARWARLSATRQDNDGGGGAGGPPCMVLWCRTRGTRPPGGSQEVPSRCPQPPLLAAAGAQGGAAGGAQRAGEAPQQQGCAACLPAAQRPCPACGRMLVLSVRATRPGGELKADRAAASKQQCEWQRADSQASTAKMSVALVEHRCDEYCSHLLRQCAHSLLSLMRLQQNFTAPASLGNGGDCKAASCSRACSKSTGPRAGAHMLCALLPSPARPPAVGTPPPPRWRDGAAQTPAQPA